MFPCLGKDGMNGSRNDKLRIVIGQISKEWGDARCYIAEDTPVQGGLYWRLDIAGS